MKKKIVLGILLIVSGVIQGMETNKRLVRMGGFSGYGRKECQEDRFVCGVIKDNNDNKLYCTLIADGHSGDKVASFLQARFLPFVQGCLKDNKSINESLKYAASQCETLVLNNENYNSSGSTLLASCFNEKDNKLHLLWVGDSRAVFGGNYFYSTYDHKPTEESEKKRIEEVGHKIDEYGKLQGLIGVSRSIGDKLIKERCSSLIAIPDYVDCLMFPDDYFCIGASDGFWDVVKKKEVAMLLAHAQSLADNNFYEHYCNGWDNKIADDVVAKNNDRIELNNDFEDKDAARIARKLVHVALYRGSRDNITVVVTLFGEKQNVWIDANGNEHDDTDGEGSEFYGSDSDNQNSFEASDCLEIEGGLDALKNFDQQELDDKSGVENAEDVIDGEDRGSDGSEEVVFSQTESNNDAKSSTSLSELDLLEYTQQEKIDEPVITQAYWKAFIQNHKYKIGGLATILAIIVAAYKYNYLHLNYMMV